MKFIASLLIGLAGSLPAANRFDEFTSKNASPKEPVKVLNAGLLGGTGVEWLAGGGIQPDSTIMLGGVSLGPVLDMGGKETVLGKDGPITAPSQAPQLDKKGRPEQEKDGKAKLAPFSWNHENATGFVVRLSPDLKTIKSVTRLPWKSGGLTSAVVGSDGSIFIAGPATSGVINLAMDSQELPAAQQETKRDAKSPGCTHTYLAKLSPDASRILWLRHVKGGSGAPRLLFDAKKRLIFQGPDFRFLDPGNGKPLIALPRPGGHGGHGGQIAINPLDGTMARGGEHHSPTGREPWRCPTLDIFKSDGALLHQLYDWGGPFVGLNNLRLVSDSAIRGVDFDGRGHLLIHAWSDGGNSVMLREPNDIRTMARMEGLGFSSWGAGVLSLAYILKLDTQSWQVIGGTSWMAYRRDQNKPNSARIHSMMATGGAVCFAGASTNGLIQTGDAIGGGEPGGEFVAVLNDDCSALRFSSAMPACGQAIVNDHSADGARWSITTGTLEGRSVALFLGSAAERNTGYDTNPPPSVNARQSKHGGGAMDGYALLIDLSK
jgi:hypothetical protein